MIDAVRSRKFTPAQVPGLINKTFLPGVAQPDLASGNAAPTSAEPASQPAFPSLASQASNLFQAAVAFVGDGCALVDDAEYRHSLEICRTCDQRVGERCTACGCWIKVKARGRAFTCPLERW
ncbi:MAG: DUF6171 family protein [Thermoguttaceae bacterium]|jgi:hypothetical protein